MILPPGSDDGPDLTKYFRSYRECVRTVWNLFLMTYPDGERDFFQISRELCDAMVVSQVGHFSEQLSLDELEYYPGLCVLPFDAKKKLDALCATKHPDSYVWKTLEWSADVGELRFRSLFDFESFGGVYRDFRYAECIVVRSHHESIVAGQRVLLDAVDVRVVDVSEAVPDRSAGDESPSAGPVA